VLYFIINLLAEKIWSYFICQNRNVVLRPHSLQFYFIPTG